MQCLTTSTTSTTRPTTSTTMHHLLTSVLVGATMADYPHYTDYNSGYTSLYSTHPNTSGLSSTRRTWDPKGPFTFSFTVGMTIPLPDLDTTLTVELPFTFDIAGTAAARQWQGRSLDHRSTIFSQLSRHLGQLAGGHSGQACLARSGPCNTSSWLTSPTLPRTICEVAATPGHADGLWGELTNVVMSASSSLGEELGELVSPAYRAYLEAEQLGRAGDCSSLTSRCPVSFFSFI